MPSRNASRHVAPALALTLLAAAAARAEVVSPAPGEVYREFYRIMRESTTKEWRVTDPNATFVGDPTNSPSYFLPNLQLPFTIPAGALVGATRAEAVLDYWGGHVGTKGARVRFNSNPWLNVPELKTTPTEPECYVQQWNPVVPIPIAQLREGTNTIEGTSGGQTCFNFGWGQWGWYAAIIRVYYNPASVSPPTGSITSPLSNSTFGDNPSIGISASGGGGIARVEVFARYEGADHDGDGSYLEYHQAYHRLAWATTIGTSGHVGSDTTAPHSLVWDTTLVPDQQNVRLQARILGTNGLWYTTPEVTGLTLRRPSSSVVLFKPAGVPRSFWVRAISRNLSHRIPISGVNLAAAVSAKLVVPTWNGLDGQAEPGQTHFTKLNAWTAPVHGKDHFYSFDVLDVPPSALRNGDNVLLVDSLSSHHGIELLWPGAQLVVRFNTPSTAVCGDGRIDAGELCDDGNTTSGDGCEATCTLPGLGICGDGTLNTGEHCDDGNRIGGDGCEADCTLLAIPRPLPAMYRFEESGGAVVEDVASDNDGALAAPAEREAVGRFGRAVRFDGAGGNVDLGGFDVGGDQLTIALWIRPDDFGIPDARLISKASGLNEPDHYWMLSTVNQSGINLRFRLKTEDGFGGRTSTVVASSNLAAGIWTHVAGVYDGAQMKLYQNGQLVGSLAKTGTIAGSAGIPAWIGDQPGGSKSFDGTIDEVLIEGRALTQDEVRRLMASALEPPQRDCGNGDLDGEEECDDGNTTSGDGCQSDCRYPRCGDEFVDPDEECDDGNTMDGDGCQGGCDRPVCGDGIADPGEGCDDGNTIDDDSCSDDCTSNTPLNLLRNGSFSSGTSEWLFFSNGTATFDAPGGTARVAIAVAGTNVQLFQAPVALRGDTPYRLRLRGRNTGGDDAVVQLGKHTSPYTAYGLSRTLNLTSADQPFEVLFTTTPGDKPDARFTIWLADHDRAGNSYFFDDLVLEQVTGCGNGRLDAGEECDDGNNASGDACLASCRLPVPGVCGDGQFDFGEECDDGNATSGDGCSATCVQEAPPAPPDPGQFRQPLPGSVYKEFSRIMGGAKDWRVTDPNAPASAGGPTNNPTTYLPNSVLPITIDDLVGAVRAEAVLEVWGGHTGTTLKRIRFNGRPYVPIPELATTPTPGQCYMQQWNVTVDIPLADLVQGANVFEGTSGGQTCYNFNWGQWGWYSITVRVYYDPATKPHPTGTITAPVAGAFVGSAATIGASTSPGVNRVDFLAWYYGPDFDGDGRFHEFHEAYHAESGSHTIGISRHVGTDTTAPFAVTWDTALVPEQTPGTVKLIARLRDTSGTWFVTDEVAGLSLQRPGRKVRMYAPENVPENFWIRGFSPIKSSQFTIPPVDPLGQALSAKLVLATWNGINGGTEPGETHAIRVNGSNLPLLGRDHFFSLDVVDVPLWMLRSGVNTVEVFCNSTHHGIEVLWPGPHAVVTYSGPATVCGNGLVESGEQCDDGNATAGDACTNACRDAVCGDGVVRSGIESCDDGNRHAGDGCENDCTTTPPANCGDGVVGLGEQCDDGNAVPTDACTNACRNAACGDGIVRAGVEACDDGNLTAGDGCDAQCRIEACGNGRVDAGEQCDDGNPVQTDACTNACRDAACGDGTVRAGVEACDDGNLVAADGCDAQCRVEACGNGRVDAGEACDDGNSVDADACSNVCVSNAPANLLRNGDFAQGTLHWLFYSNGNASFDIQAGAARIPIVVEGNNVQLYQLDVPLQGATQYRLRLRARNTGGDDAIVELLKHTAPYTNLGLFRVLNLTPTDQVFEIPFTTLGGTLTDARFRLWLADYDRAGNNYHFDDILIERVTTTVCGNGVSEAGEQCDDGNRVDTDACTNVCRNAVCGDGRVRAGSEQCDDGNLTPGDGCDAQCRSEACGNGRLDGGEECDDGNGVSTDACTATCRNAICGDGVVRAGVEECDDGNTVSTDACTGTCRNAVCGDRIVRAGVEDCDDGNTDDADGCTNACTVVTVVVNLLANPKFDAGTAAWGLYSNGIAAFDAPGATARVSITSSGNNVQLFQANVALRGLSQYRLRFRARNTTGDDVQLRMFKHTAPFDDYGLSRVVDLTTTDQVFVITFTTTPGDKPDARFVLWLADYDRPGSQYYFDDFELVRLP